MRILTYGRIIEAKELHYEVEYTDDNCNKIRFIKLVGYIDKNKPKVYINTYYDKTIEDMENLMLDIACEKETYLIE